MLGGEGEIIKVSVRRVLTVLVYDRTAVLHSIINWGWKVLTLPSAVSLVGCDLPHSIIHTVKGTVLLRARSWDRVGLVGGVVYYAI